MQTRLFSLGLGVVYLLVGIVGFFPAFYNHPPAGAPTLTATGGYGYLFGLFPVNYWHDALHIVAGLAGIICYFRYDAARIYSRILFLGFGILAFLGFIPATNTLGGVLPIFSGDTWLHAATAIAGAYFGFIAPEPTYVEPVPGY